MERRPIELRIAGQNYRVVSSAPEQELHRLAEIVATKLAEVVPPGRPHPPQAMLLAAIALAHDAESARGERMALERRTRDLLHRALTRIDEALEPLEQVEGTEQEVSRETGDAPGAPILG